MPQSIVRSPLLDRNCPNGLVRALSGFLISTTEAEGWNTLKNAELLKAAEAANFEIMLTADQNLKHQNNLSLVRLGIVVLSTPKWTVLRNHIPTIQAALATLPAGAFRQIDFPLPPLRRRDAPKSKT